MEKGKPKRKYIAPYGDNRHLYFVSGCAEMAGDFSVPVVLVEAEKSALALTGWAERNGRKILPVAMGGSYGWRGRIGKTVAADGTRVDETGPLPDLAVCRNRDVVIMLDSNADTKPEVRAARTALTRALEQMGARVRIATVPALEGVNGPDDLIAVAGDEAISDVLELSQPVAKAAVAEVEQAIKEILAAKPEVTAEQMTCALDAVANVTDSLQREMLENRLASAVRGVVPKSTVVRQVAARSEERAGRQQDCSNRNREAELRAIPVAPNSLIAELEAFYAARAHLPAGAALVFAYFTVNTWTFELFETVPYLLLESAVPGCGKSTVIRLLESLCCRSRKASSLSEAVMFRLIEAEAPTLLIDEAETFDGRSDKSAALRAIANEGYKRGGVVPRCEGDAHEIRWFHVYGPKVFAAINGLTGALLDRCLVIHMEKAPRGSVRRSTRQRTLRRDAQHLVVQLEAYALQAAEALRQFDEAEPDSGYWSAVADREDELWGPLLIHARLAGPDAEAQLLAVVNEFIEQKVEIKSADYKIAQTIALRDAISDHPETTFTPGELPPRLAQSEAWAKTLAEVKGRDDDSVRVSQAARIGYFLRSFRLRGTKNSRGQIAYDREAAILCLSAHVPQNPPSSPKPPSMNSGKMEFRGTNVQLESTEASEAFGVQFAPDQNANHRGSKGHEVDSSESPSTTDVAVLPGVEMEEGEI